MAWKAGGISTETCSNRDLCIKRRRRTKQRACFCPGPWKKSSPIRRWREASTTSSAKPVKWRSVSGLNCCGGSRRVYHQNTRTGGGGGGLWAASASFSVSSFALASFYRCCFSVCSGGLLISDILWLGHSSWAHFNPVNDSNVEPWKPRRNCARPITAFYVALFFRRASPAGTGLQG